MQALQCSSSACLRACVRVRYLLLLRKIKSPGLWKSVSSRNSWWFCLHKLEIRPLSSVLVLVQLAFVMSAICLFKKKKKKISFAYSKRVQMSLKEPNVNTSQVLKSVHRGVWHTRGGAGYKVPGAGSGWGSGTGDILLWLWVFCDVQCCLSHDHNT